MARKVILIGFLGLLRPGSVAQLISASMVAIVILLAHAVAQPFRKLDDSVLALICDVVRRLSYESGALPVRESAICISAAAPPGLLDGSALS